MSRVLTAAWDALTLHTSDAQDTTYKPVQLHLHTHTHTHTHGKTSDVL
jgi:hypothetical protein